MGWFLSINNFQSSTSLATKLPIIHLHAVLKETHCEIQTITGEKVALVSNQIHSVLKNMPTMAPLQLDAFVSEQEWTKSITNFTNGSKRVLMSVDLQICGSVHDANIVAKSLSHAELFLQHPHFETAPIKYDNPQYLVLPQYKLAEEFGLEHVLCEETKQSESIHWIGKNLVENIEIFFDELPEHEYLTDFDLGLSTKTPLLKLDTQVALPTLKNHH
jgi:hypothetical protein